MAFIDMHCDTISRLCAVPEESLVSNRGCIDKAGMIEAGTMALFFASFVNVGKFEPVRGGELSDTAWEQGFRMVRQMIRRMDEEQDENIRVIRSFAEMEENEWKGRISAIMTVEEGGIINRKIHRLKSLYEEGIRLITLTWNHPNCIGFPNSRDSNMMEKGLTSFGIQVVERMNHLGMMIDVSHLSDGGFWDCLRLSCAPICASHSNARTLCNHPRNLSDEMLKALGEKGGIAGLNFYPAFLREKGTVVLDDIARHAIHMIREGGEEVVAIGTDFDGFENRSAPLWIAHVREMDLLWEAMKSRGITERQLDKIMRGNVMRFMQEVVK